MNWKGCGRELPWTNLWHYPGIYQEVRKVTTKRPVMVVCVPSGIRTLHPGLKVRSVATWVKSFSLKVLYKFVDEPSASIESRISFRGWTDKEESVRMASVTGPLQYIEAPCDIWAWHHTCHYPRRARLAHVQDGSGSINNALSVVSLENIPCVGLNNWI
jgi:hypothetical protein